MKDFFVFVFILGFVLCASASEVSAAKKLRGSQFTPAQLPCGFRIAYNATRWVNKSPLDRFWGWVSMYGDYLAESVSGPSYSHVYILRRDITQSSEIAIFVGHDSNGEGACVLQDYYLDYDVYDHMPSFYKYFKEPFEYDSMNKNDTWNGTSCRSYTKKDDIQHITIYANDKGRVIGISEATFTQNVTYNINSYEETAHLEDFRMEKHFRSCKRSEVYANPPENPKCAPASEKEFNPKKQSCAFKVNYTKNYVGARNNAKFNCWVARYGREVSHYEQGPGMNGDIEEFLYLLRLDIRDPSFKDTAELFIASNIKGLKACVYRMINKYDDLYYNMDKDYTYFSDSFSYESMDKNAKWNGVSCVSYTQNYYAGQSTTIYADKDNQILGILVNKGVYNITYNIDEYQEPTTSDFKMPEEYKQCGDSQVYEDPAVEPNCTPLKKDFASSLEVPFFAVVALAIMVSFLTLF